jgi:hypothetical protein
MVLYEVILEVELPLNERLTHYMRSSRVPAIYRTGCFRRISFSASLEHPLPHVL